MHPNEVRATPELVRRLIAKQFPQWAHLPLTQLDREGTDHVLFRLGDTLLVRMPKIDWAADQAASDARWLPKLAPDLPAQIPAPVGVGEPDESYPWQWTVVPWIVGANPRQVDRSAPSLARDVAAFTHALQAIDTAGGPPKIGQSRGTPLPPNDDTAQDALRELAHHDDGIDLGAVAKAWDDAVSAPPWDQPPVWIHGDLQPGNLIVQDGRLAAVIDFGGLGLGDPAPDAAAAFWTFQGEARRSYRDELACDDATWRRARGWALLPSLTGLNYYRHSFPAHGHAITRDHHRRPGRLLGRYITRSPSTSRSGLVGSPVAESFRVETGDFADSVGGCIGLASRYVDGHQLEPANLPAYEPSSARGTSARPKVRG